MGRSLIEVGESLVLRVEEYMTRVEEVARSRTCPSRQHHYVPRAYLRAWSPDGTRVRVVNKVAGRDQLQGLAFSSRYEAADELSTRQLDVWDDPEGRFITSDQPVLPLDR